MFLIRIRINMFDMKYEYKILLLPHPTGPHII